MKIHRESESIWLKSVEIPELHIAGDTLEQAPDNALKDFEAVLPMYVSQRRSIPVGHIQPHAEDVHLHLPARTAAKVALWNALLESGTTRTELARRLACRGATSIASSAKIDSSRSVLGDVGMLGHLPSWS